MRNIIPADKTTPLDLNSGMRPLSIATCSLVAMDEKTVQEVQTGAFSKVLSALQNTPGNKSSSQRDGRSSSAASTSRLNDVSSLRSGTDSGDSMIDFKSRLPNKKKRYLCFLCPDTVLLLHSLLNWVVKINVVVGQPSRKPHPPI